MALINNALLVINTDLLNKSYLLYWTALRAYIKPFKQLEYCYSISLYCRLRVVTSLSAFLNSCIGFLLDHHSWHKKETCPFKLHFMKRKGRRGNTGFHRIVESWKLEKTLKIIPRKEGRGGGKGVSLLLTFTVAFYARIREMRLERQYPMCFKRIEGCAWEIWHKASCRGLPSFSRRFFWNTKVYKSGFFPPTLSI